MRGDKIPGEKYDIVFVCCTDMEKLHYFGRVNDAYSQGWEGGNVYCLGAHF